MRFRGSFLNRIGEICSPSRVWLKSLPHDRAFSTLDYERFMREETFKYTPKYASEKISVHGVENLSGLNGAVLVFLHYGSFFLSGGALLHQYGLPYNLIASRRNLRLMAGREADFWRGVHHRSAKLFSQPELFFSDQSPFRMRQWLAGGALLGAAIDVREEGVPQRSQKFLFLGHPLYFHLGPARLAVATRKPLAAMTIRFNSKQRRHDLFIGPARLGNDPQELVQASLDDMAPIIEPHQNQFFHDILGHFSQPHDVAF